MASTVFEGTSIANMFVTEARVSAACLWPPAASLGQAGPPTCAFRRGPADGSALGGGVGGDRGVGERGCAGAAVWFEIRAVWSDRHAVCLRRSYVELGGLLAAIIHTFASDGEHRDIAASAVLTRYVAVKQAVELEDKVVEAERLLGAILQLPAKFSRSEPVLSFFERGERDELHSDDAHAEDAHHHDHDGDDDDDDGGDEEDQGEVWLRRRRTDGDLPSPDSLAEIMGWDVRGFAPTRETRRHGDPAGTAGHPAVEMDTRRRTNAGNTRQPTSTTASATNTTSATESLNTVMSYYQLVPFDTD